MTVPSRAVVASKDAGDHVQIHLPAMADGIALENRRMCGAATPEGAQVTCFVFPVLYMNEIENDNQKRAVE